MSEDTEVEAQPSSEEEQTTKAPKRWALPVAVISSLAVGVGVGAAIWLPMRNSAQAEAEALGAQLSTAESNQTSLEDEISSLQEQISELEGQGGDGTVDGMKACEILFSGDDTLGVIGEIPEAITSIGAAITAEQDAKLWSIKETLEEAASIAPAELRAAIVDVAVPFAQYTEAVNSGKTDVRMDTSGMLDKTTRIMSACVDEGFRIS